MVPQLLLEPDTINVRILREMYNASAKGADDVKKIEGVAGCPPGKKVARFWSGSDAQVRLGQDPQLSGSGGYLSQLGALVDEGTARINDKNIQHMKIIEVERATLTQLLDQTSLSRPLALVIDAEGHNAVILTQFVVEGGLRPHVLMYEVEHLSPETQIRLMDSLDELGGEYACTSLDQNQNQNIVCWRGWKDSNGEVSTRNSMVRFLFDVCWCPEGFGRYPFPKCFGSSLGCKTENDGLVSSEELLMALDSIYEQAGARIWSEDAPS